MIEKKNHIIALLLSVFPGLSQLYVGKRKKAVFLFVIDTGIILTIIFSDSYIMRFLMTGIYLVTFLPASMEGYQLAKYGKNTIDTSARWYVTVLLLTTGFTALPLLWHSDRFSRKTKIAWSIAVPVLAVTFFSFVITYWEFLESSLKELTSG